MWIPAAAALLQRLAVVLLLTAFLPSLAACSDGVAAAGEGGAGGDAGSGTGRAGGFAGGPPAPPPEEIQEIPEGPRPGPLLTADCPLPEPSNPSASACFGCLCASERWSCSEDTRTDDDGNVVGLAAEAGYIEVPGGDYTGRGEVRTGPTHRVFYSFQPADSSPEERPLAVFFNGGPGSATTSVLMALNTAPLTLDPERTGSADIAENELSFTRAFNLLYIDAPGTGFSYALPLESGEAPPDLLDTDRDAAVFNHVLLFFLARHPLLKHARTILIGESYGGIRAGQMLRQLLSPETLLERTSPYGDRALYCALQEHFDDLRLSDDEDIVTADIAAQFGHVGLIQPWLLGFRQDQHSVFDSSACVAEAEPYQCDEPLGQNDALTAELVRRLLVPDNLQRMLGTDPSTIAWLDPALRHPSYEMDGESEVFVSLAAFDGSIGRAYVEPYMGAEFILLLPHLRRALITRAQLDQVIDSYGFVRAAESFNVPIEEAPTQPADAARPGIVTLKVTEDREATLRMPVYDKAGHSVTHRAPGEFFDDLVEWMED